MAIYPIISLSLIRRKIVDQAVWVENMRDFPSEEIQLGYRLCSPLSIEEIVQPVLSGAKESSKPLATPAQP